MEKGTFKDGRIAADFRHCVWEVGGKSWSCYSVKLRDARKRTNRNTGTANFRGVLVLCAGVYWSCEAEGGWEEGGGGARVKRRLVNTERNKEDEEEEEEETNTQTNKQQQQQNPSTSKFVGRHVVSRQVREKWRAGERKSQEFGEKSFIR